MFRVLTNADGSGIDWAGFAAYTELSTSPVTNVTAANACDQALNYTGEAGTYYLLDKGASPSTTARPRSVRPTASATMTAPSRSAGIDHPGQAIATSRMRRPTTIIPMRVDLTARPRGRRH